MMVWKNGIFHESDKRMVDLTDRGLLLADGLFETILIKAGHPVFFDAHMARMRRGAEILRIPILESDEVIFNALIRLVQDQGNNGSRFAARITLTRGGGARGIVPPPVTEVSPTLFAAITPLAEPPVDPVQLIISSVRRNEGSPTSRLKTLAYTDNILARMEAEKAGVEDAVMLNSIGNISCTSIANIFILRPQKRLETPDLSSGVLPGIVRSIILELAENIGLEINETKLPIQSLGEAEVFLTNSLLGVRPAFLLPTDNDQCLPPGSSDVFLELQRQYAHRVDLDIRDRKMI